MQSPHEHLQCGPGYLLSQDLNALLDFYVMEVEADLDNVQNYEEAIDVQEQREEPMLMEENESEDEMEPSTATKPPRIWPEFARCGRYVRHNYGF